MRYLMITSKLETKNLNNWLYKRNTKIEKIFSGKKANKKNYFLYCIRNNSESGELVWLNFNVRNNKKNGTRQNFTVTLG